MNFENRRRLSLPPGGEVKSIASQNFGKEPSWLRILSGKTKVSRSPSPDFVGSSLPEGAE